MEVIKVNRQPPGRPVMKEGPRNGESEALQESLLH